MQYAKDRLCLNEPKKNGMIFLTRLRIVAKRGQIANVTVETYRFLL